MRAALRRYRRLALIVTIGVSILVVAGGAVRLTGSGLGCDDWPNCNDTRFIDVSSGHAAIEQANRLFSGLIGIPTLWLAVLAVRRFPRGDGFRWPALGVLVSVLANGIVGGIAVRGDLHPALVQSHFLLAMVSIWFGVLAVERARAAERGEPHAASVAAVLGRIHDTAVRWTLVVVVLTVVALVTGTVVTGTGPHAGDETARRFGYDIGSVARLHSISVLVTLAAVLALAWVVHRDDTGANGDGTGARGTGARVRNALSAWIFVGVVQGGIGYVQYFTGVPELLVGAHLAGATLLWVLTVRLLVVVLREVGVGSETEMSRRAAVPA